LARRSTPDPYREDILMAHDENPDHEAHGTFVIIMIFFATFLVYYLLNWKFLGEVWKTG
jgi:hypothetical protein